MQHAALREARPNAACSTARGSVFRARRHKTLSCDCTSHVKLAQLSRPAATCAAGVSNWVHLTARTAMHHVAPRQPWALLTIDICFAICYYLLLHVCYLLLHACYLLLFATACAPGTILCYYLLLHVPQKQSFPWSAFTQQIQKWGAV
jgi:hypothetical protein